MDDLRFAIRRLVRHPAATVVSVFALAVGIGAGAATWSLLSALLLSPLPSRELDRLVVPGMSGVRRDGALSDTFTYPYYRHFTASGIFEAVAADWPGMSLMIDTPRERAQAAIDFVSHDFFDVLDAEVTLGRDFASGDDVAGAHVAVVSDSYWRRALGGSPDVVGQAIHIFGQRIDIIGVAPRGFRGLDLGRSVDVYLPLHTIGNFGGPFVNYFAAPKHQSSPSAGLRLIGRMLPGDTAAALRAKLTRLTTPDGRPTQTYGFTPLRIAMVPPPAREGLRTFAQVLAATVSFLILIGCFTVGMLLMVRTEARREELAMCRALGASRWRLARGIGLEGALLAGGGAVAAIPIAAWLFRGVRAFQVPGGINIDLLDMSVDGASLGIVAAVAVAATLLIALIAGAFSIVGNVGDALRSRAGATPTVSRRAMRAFVITAQTAIALVLVTGAALFGQSLQRALMLNPGFDTARIVNVPLPLRQFEYSQPRATALVDRAIARLRAHPGIESVSVMAPQGGMSGKLIVNGQPREIRSVTFTVVGDAFFQTLGVRVSPGRVFSEQDAPNGPPVGIASASFARFLGHGIAIGSRITMPFSRPPAPPPVVEVIGVVPDLITSVTALEPMVLYLRRVQTPPSIDATLVLRASDAAAAKRDALVTIREIDERLKPGPMVTIDERLAQQMGPQRFGATVLGTLGAIAVLLTLLGAYVLAESLAVSRLREMGVRAALGAQRGHLARLMMRQTIVLVAAGLFAGIALTWWSARLVRALLFSIEPLDPATLASVAAMILALTVVVTMRPVLRVAKMDLARVLREP